MRTLRIATWNLDGLEDRHLDVRTEAAMVGLLLRRDAPDVLLLQEVVPRTYHAHLRPHLAAAGYRLIPPAAPEREYFVAVAVRGGLPLVRAWQAPFPTSRMGRYVLGVEVDVGGAVALFATAHLESLKGSREERQAQIAQVLRLLAAHPGPALFGGDTNLREEETEDVPEVADAVDAWVALGRPKDLRATWVPRTGKSNGARFDRVYLNRREGWDVVALRRLGEQELAEADGLRISDHLGLEIDVTLDVPGPPTA